MNIFALVIIVLFVAAAGVEAYAGRNLQMQIYMASAWLNIVFLYIK